MKILGQDKAIAQLKKFTQTNRIPPAMIFCGQKGIGKASAAKYLAKVLNCQDPAAKDSFTPCETCVACTSIEKNIYPDFIFADFEYQANLTGKDVEKQQHISVDTIRSITAKSQQKSPYGGWKVLVVDSADTMQSEAANALLKFIEEPPAKTLWILITQKKAVLLPTILSRSQILDFAPLSADIISSVLEEAGTAEHIIEKAVSYSQGSIARAIKAAQIFEETEDMDPSAPNFPYAMTGILESTLAVSRAQAHTILDIMSAAMHAMWTKEENEKNKQSLKKKMEKINFFKRAVNRNTSPALVLETALMESGAVNAKIFG
ncbi:DNA polymerase-3 subunit delta' [Parelusimicrobium proximum]|uniref:AAA family ATPase n=1 Tax=Parelusimicrobium proximum TaxID=3228953 RepID=UPI003D1744B3